MNARHPGLAALLAISASTGFARAQSADFACPKSGTIEERGAYKAQYEGPSPSDPYVCKSLDTWNKPRALLFNFYSPNELESGNIRTAMLDLFTGRTPSLTVQLKSGSTETWTVLRREQVNIGGSAIDTIVLDEERSRFPNSLHPFHGHYTRWLDPKDGLWVKAEFGNISGETAQERKPYQDTSIRFP
jgi:hypothetical protein